MKSTPARRSSARRDATKKPRSTRGRITGGCGCGAVRYQLLQPPLFVHACHCRWCQRESGASFALNAMIDAVNVSVTGAVALVRAPTEGDGSQWIARCPVCQIAVWSCYGAKQGSTRYLRVGTLDDPDRWGPAAHIFTSHKQPWVILPDGVPAFARHYDARKVWPEASLRRRAAAAARR